jgi:small subunit ribosomal protein S21
MGVSLVKVEVRKGDINTALKIFKRKVAKSGHIDELKARKEYTKPTTKRRFLKDKAVRINQEKVKHEKYINSLKS